MCVALTPIFKKLQILKIKKIAILQTAKIMCQFNIVKIPIKYCHLVKSDQVHNYDTRNALKYNFN